jgi:Tol biopolymer transport system component
VTVGTPHGTATDGFTYVVPEARRQAGARRPAFSFDGRFMAFESAVALVADDTNGVADVYVFDALVGTLRRVSISTTGVQAIGGESQRPAISATGRFVAFESRATNLVPSDGNALLDVFLHDRDSDNDGVFDQAGAIRTSRVSVSSAGGEASGGSSRNPSISGNGRWVAFESAAANLVEGDTNGLIDIVVHDALLGVTSRVDVSTSGGQSAGGHSASPVISLDGRWVAFDSTATNPHQTRDWDLSCARTQPNFAGQRSRHAGPLFWRASDYRR